MRLWAIEILDARLYEAMRPEQFNALLCEFNTMYFTDQNRETLIFDNRVPPSRSIKFGFIFKEVKSKTRTPLRRLLWFME